MSQQNRFDPVDDPNRFAYGTNFLNSKDIFTQRLIYNYLIFSPSEFPRLFETWGKDRYYGIANTKGNTVVVDQNELRPLSFPETDSEFCLNFVADAWRDFALRLRELADKNIIFRNSPWAAPTVTKAWVSLNTEYEEYMNTNLYPAFHQIYLEYANRQRQIGGMGGFLAVFEEFVDEVVSLAGPLTPSGLLEGNYVPPLVSGLMLEIHQGDYDQDFYKSYVYKDMNFQLVEGLAQQYGFAIDKNIPWRIVADLRNPAMREYMYGVPIVEFDPDAPPPEDCDPKYTNPDLFPRAFGYSQIPGLENVERRVNVYVEGSELKPGYAQYQRLRNVTDQERIFEVLYEEAFVETWHTDMSELQKYLLNFYNAYAVANPITTIREPLLVGRPCPPASRVIERFPITEEEFADRYGDLWRLKTFYVTRSMERSIRNPRSAASRIFKE